MSIEDAPVALDSRIKSENDGAGVAAAFLISDL